MTTRIDNHTNQYSGSGSGRGFNIFVNTGTHEAHTVVLSESTAYFYGRLKWKLILAPTVLGCHIHS